MCFFFNIFNTENIKTLIRYNCIVMDKRLKLVYFVKLTMSYGQLGLKIHRCVFVNIFSTGSIKKLTRYSCIVMDKRVKLSYFVN